MNPPPTLFPQAAPGSEPAKLPFLRIYFKGEFVRSFRIEPGVHTAGRAKGAAIFLDDRFVSRRHFQIEFKGENLLYIQDLGSANGTYVNGREISRAPLGHGDEIRLGDLRIAVFHRAYARSNVIAFPEQRTEPHFDTSRLEAPDFASFPAPREEAAEGAPVAPAGIKRPAAPRKAAPAAYAPPAPRPVPRLALGATVVLSAVALAIGARYAARRWDPGFLRGWERSAPEPVVRPGVPVAPGVSPGTVRPGRSARPKEPVRPPARPPAEAARKPAQAPSPPASESARRDLEQTLDSLRGLEAPGPAELKPADRLSTGPVPSLSSNLVALKEMKKGSVRTIDVEIQMPRMEDPARQAAGSGPGRAADPAKFDYRAYQAMLKGRLAGMEECSAKFSKGGTGKVAVWMSIGGDGKVRSSGVGRSTMKNEPLERCILERVGRIEADPPPWDGFTVTYAFKFGVSRVRFD